jgi:hypothetical protein
VAIAALVNAEAETSYGVAPGCASARYLETDCIFSFCLNGFGEPCP